MDDEIEIDLEWYNELVRRCSIQACARENIEVARTKNPDDNEKELRALDSALKKTTSFMKKIKTLNAASISGIIQEMSKLNLSKFVEEMASAIIEAKLKIADIENVVVLCQQIEMRYPNFSEILIGEFKKVLPLKKADTITNSAKLRVDVLLLAELVVCGFFMKKDGLQILGGVLTYIVQTDKTEFVNVGLLNSICRNVGWQIAGICPLPSGQETMNVQKKDLPSSTALTEEQKTSIRNLLMGYYEALYNKTEKACTARNKSLKKVKKQERTRGDAAESERNALNQAQTEFDHCRKLVGELSCALGVALKEFNEEASDDEEDEAANVEMGRALAEGEVHLWQDDETRAFYENILDLRETVPKSLYEESEKRTIESGPMQKNIDDIDMDNLNEQQSVDLSARARSFKEGEQSFEEHRDLFAISDEKEKVTNNWQSFMLDLNHCVSKYSADKAAIFFVSSLNTKSNRKKLVNLMVNPPQSRLDLLPFYARLVATLEAVMPDVTIEVVNNILAKFKEYMQDNGNARIQDKLSCVMMIAELMKFGLISRAEGLSCLRQLVYDLRGHCVDMTATMLESGGFYLYRHTDSHAKMKRLLEVVKAKRDRMKDNRYIMLIDNAYFACLPPEDSAQERARMQNNRENTPMKMFIRHIILDINSLNVDDCLKGLRKLDWADPEIRNYTLKYLSSPWLLPVENLQHLASAVTGLSNLSLFKWVGVAVTDAILEMIRLSLELPGVFNQWSQAAIIYLGELYNFSFCDEELLVKVMYQIITFPENEATDWRNLHRVRLVCSLLKVSGEYLKKERKLQIKYFLIYFYRYYYMKKEQWDAEIAKLMEVGAIEECGSVLTKFPFEVETAFIEVSKLFRTRSRLPQNLADATKMVEDIEARYKDMANLDQSESDRQPIRRESDDLDAILEEEEDEEEPEAQDSDDMVCDFGDDQKLRYHIEKEREASKEEDEEFQRELDRLLSDSYRTPVVQNINAVDISLPASIKTRFERTIKFADEEGDSNPTTSVISLAHSKETRDGDDEPPRVQKVVLMTRGKKNKPQLKTIAMEDPELRKRWELERKREAMERENNKMITLGHQRRIENEEQKALEAQMNRMKIKKYHH
ncbi:unnamed protein product [Caenorhabditis bovis]|uniref:MIF4G domain-containing protein n=1 Tax=Caenorhabditis bovis TaxID=2654633 RepID=A0A8S1F0P7_9PELO|nr:unnamed protein product [Caenorhabditis bovis]